MKPVTKGPRRPVNGAYFRLQSIKLLMVLAICIELWTLAFYLYYTAGDDLVKPGSRSYSFAAPLNWLWTTIVTKLMKSRTPNVLIYITTHLSDMHVRYLEKCWPALLSKSPLFRRSHLMMFITAPEDTPINRTVIQNVFSNVDITVHVRPNPGYNEGAVLAMGEAFANGWFDPYDWVVRVNPDVLIRNDSFLLNVFEDDSINGIFADCLDVPCPEGKQCNGRLVHTDFFAFRPRALPRAAFSAASPATNAERMVTHEFSPIILNGTERWVPGAGPHGGICRVRGEASPVVHTHDFDDVYPACISWYQ